MKKTLYLLLAVAIVVMVFGLSGPALAASSLVVAQDTPPRMMNPHGSDADANLSFMANFFDGLLQRKGLNGTLAPASGRALGAAGSVSWKVLSAQRG